MPVFPCSGFYACFCVFRSSCLLLNFYGSSILSFCTTYLIRSYCLFQFGFSCLFMPCQLMIYLFVVNLFRLSCLSPYQVFKPVIQSQVFMSVIQSQVFMPVVSRNPFSTELPMVVPQDSFKISWLL